MMTRPGKIPRYVSIAIIVCGIGLCAGRAHAYAYSLGWGCPYGLANLDKPEAKAYEPWFFRTSDGQVLTPSPSWTLCCLNSPYRDHAVREIENYFKKNPSDDSLFVDALWWGCYGDYWCCCDHCKKSYRAKFGKDMPIFHRLDWWGSKLPPSDIRQAIEWRRDTLEEISREIVAKVKAIRPNIKITLHGMTSFHDAGNDLFSRLSCLRMSDFVYMENYYDEVFWAAWFRGVARRPMICHTPYLQDGCSIEPPMPRYVGDVFHAVASGLLAQGCVTPSTGVPPSCKSNKSLLELVDQEFKEKRQYVEGASPILYAAIVYSEATRTYYGRGDREKLSLPNVRGAFEVMQRLRVPVEFLADMDLDLENLKKFQVVILPNTAILTPPQVAAIHRYVKEGGAILSTYETSLYDECGERKPNFDLSDVFGLKYVEMAASAPAGNCLAPRDGLLAHLQDILAPFQSGKPATVNVQSLHIVAGPFVKTEATRGTTKATYTLIDKITNVPQSQPSSIPAVHFNNFGKGKSVYISKCLFKMHTIGPEGDSTTGSVLATPFNRRGWITDLTGELLDWLAPNPPMKAEGSPLLECTFFEQKEKGRYIVHLLNSGVAKLGTAFDLEPARILIRKDFVKPQQIYSAWPERTNLKAEDRGKYLEVSVPKTRIHQIVVVER